jgi:hypothetical protein
MTSKGTVNLVNSEDERELFLWRWKDVTRDDISKKLCGLLDALVILTSLHRCSSEGIQAL